MPCSKLIKNRTIFGVASLNRGPVGYVGPRPIVLEQLQLLVAQLAVFLSTMI